MTAARILGAFRGYIVRRQESKLAHDFTLALFTNIALMGLALVTSTLQARLLGPEGRGQLAAIQLGGLFLLGIGHLGIPTALVYYTGRGRGDRGETGRYVATAWALMLPQSILWIAAGWFLLPLLLQSEAPAVLRYAQYYLLLLPFAYVSQASMALQGMKAFRHWSLMRLHKPVLYTGAIVALGLLGIASPYTFALASLGLGVAGTLLVIILLRRVGLRFSRPSIVKARELLQYGVRAVAGSVPEELNSRVDQLLIVLWLTASELGLYVVAVGWSLLLVPVVQALAAVVFPYVASMGAEDQQLRFFARSVRGTLFAGTLGYSLWFLLTPVLLPLLFGEDFRSAIPPAMVLSAAGIAFSTKLVLSNGLKGLGQPTATAIAELVSLLATALLLVALLPRLGIVGAAIASLVAYSASALVLIAYADRRLGLSAKTLLVPQRRDLIVAREQASAFLRRRPMSSYDS